MHRLAKVRIYELAKELNTTSKRVIEKLEEINIKVKNHMSLIEDDQLEAFYKHIGIIRHDDGNKPGADDKKTITSAQPSRESRKEIKSGPRIIRKTEIIIDSEDDEQKQMTKGRSIDTGSDVKSSKGGIVRKADSSTGLRPGFIRDTGNDLRKAALEKSAKAKIKETVSTQAEPERPIAKEEVSQKEDKKTVAKKDDATVIKNNVGKEENKNKSDKQGKTVEKESVKMKEKSTGTAVASASKSISAQKDDLSKDHEKSGKKKKAEISKEAADSKDNRHLKASEHEGKSERTQESLSNKQIKESSTKHGHGDHPRQNAADNAARSGLKTLDIPKTDYNVPQKEEKGVRLDIKKEYHNKNLNYDTKKELPKSQIANKHKKFKPQKVLIAGKQGVADMLSDDFILDDLYEERKFKKPVKQKKNKAQEDKVQEKHIPPKAVLTSIKIPEIITVKDLAEAMKKTAAEVIKKLMSLGMMVTLNQEIDFDTAALVADEFGITAEKAVEVHEEDILFDESEDKEEDLVPRPPVVTVMGHVDHGKTSLLDAIRKTNVIESEAGGITQHIGAYMVKVNDRTITFLDTPGHEAFTAMRARGAQVTDIAVIVVAADDGIMPQTVEAINHAKAANVSIIVAINKIDKPGANPDRVKQELTEHGLVPEEWGGDTICVNISAKERKNIDQLLEMILLVADMQELKANPNKQAKGTIIEARLDKGKGPTATVIVQRGVLQVGDSIIAGTTFGRIRAMTDDKGSKIKSAGPSMPAEILGLPDVPEAGEIFYVVKDEKLAKQLVEKRKLKQREIDIKSHAPKVSLDDLFSQIQEGKVKELNIIVKADVQGSVEAIKQSLEKLSNDEVRVRIIHGAVGAITESDVTLASVSNAIIIGFNIRPGANVMDAAKDAGVDIRLYRVIYNAIEDIEAAMKGMLEPTFKEVVMGHAEVRQIFKVSGVGTIGGCYVTDGKILRNSEIRVIRDSVVIYEGKLESLKRFKDDVREVAQGYECGLSIENFNDIKEGDVIESFVMEEVEK